MNARAIAAAFALTLSFSTLAACQGNNSSYGRIPQNPAGSPKPSTQVAPPSSTQTMPSSHAYPTNGGPAPSGIATASSARYKVGDTVKLNADHLPSMKGATATIKGAYKTTAYEVDFTPSNGRTPIHEHKWVVHEELKNPGAAPLAKGTSITINTEHLPGMKGAKGSVDEAKNTTVYMVDYQGPDGTKFTNHKWVIEEEITPAK
ncbi:Protein of uncharacterised function (DUF1541) [Dermatophilus congolensis]|uniref:Protein of uncharacterized function (DUF1541) n=1 Tax=Dermatophilus congolensis TaxID=1863 RepID=A0AA46BPP8_9MICO|nr:YdhK family protein [Dermatophilus congolensis]STD13570.1 Protein of uncharacterised function (DUF1541) [Dermatophilus congolensis]